MAEGPKSSKGDGESLPFRGIRAGSAPTPGHIATAIAAQQLALAKRILGEKK